METPNTIETQLSEKVQAYDEIKTKFIEAVQKYQELNQQASRIKTSLNKGCILQLVSEMGEQVAYIKDYYKQALKVHKSLLLDYTVIIPSIRNILYHNSADTEFNIGLLRSKNVPITSIGNDFQQVVDFLVSQTFNTCLSQASSDMNNIKNKMYIRTLNPAPPN